MENLVRTEAETLGPRELAALAMRLKAACDRLQQRPVDSILESIDRVVVDWLRPDSPWRVTAEALLPAATSFSPEMIRFALPTVLEAMKPPALAELLDGELSGHHALDGPTQGRHAIGPGLIVHVLSGNIAGLAVVPIALSLAVKSPVLVKAARGDRVMPALFARSLAEADPELGSCVGACYWSGGDQRCEERVFGLADLVVVYGSDASVADARARCGARFIGHGHKVSFAVVTRETSGDPIAASNAAEALALDVSLWDQRGCLSPQICFVEGSIEEARWFGELVARSLARLAEMLPPGTTTLEERAAVRRFRDDAEWRQIGGAATTVFAAKASTGWTVVVEPEAEFRPTPLCRSLRVLPVPSIDELPGCLAPASPLLEAAGLAAPEHRRVPIEELLNRAGVHRVCALGQMQFPPLSWRQGGRPRVADWVTWGL